MQYTRKSSRMPIIIALIGLIHGLLIFGYVFFIGRFLAYALVAGLLFGVFEALIWRAVLAVNSKKWIILALIVGAGTGLLFAFLLGFLLALGEQLAGHPVVGFYDPDSDSGPSYLFNLGLVSFLIAGLPALIFGTGWGVALSVVARRLLGKDKSDASAQ